MCNGKWWSIRMLHQCSIIMRPDIPVHMRGIHKWSTSLCTPVYCTSPGVYINSTSCLALHKMGVEYWASENVTPGLQTSTQFARSCLLWFCNPCYVTSCANSPCNNVCGKSKNCLSQTVIFFSSSQCGRDAMRTESGNGLTTNFIQIIQFRRPIATIPTSASVSEVPFSNIRVHAHRVKVGAKAKRIKEQAKNNGPTSKKMFAFASAFVRCEWTFIHLNMYQFGALTVKTSQCRHRFVHVKRPIHPELKRKRKYSLKFVIFVFDSFHISLIFFAFARCE